MDMIEIGSDGERIILTFKPEAGQSATCRIPPQDAVALSCLMLRAYNLSTSKSGAWRCKLRVAGVRGLGSR